MAMPLGVMSGAGFWTEGMVARYEGCVKLGWKLGWGFGRTRSRLDAMR